MPALAVREDIAPASRNGSNRPMAYAPPAEQQRRSLSELFEALIRARGIEPIERCEGAVKAFPAQNILEIGLRQYRERGNARRLTLTAELLAAAGGDGYVALLRFIEGAGDAAPELYFFVDSIARSHTFSVAQKQELLTRIANVADGDTQERLLEAAEGVDPVIERALREALGSRG